MGGVATAEVRESRALRVVSEETARSEAVERIARRIRAVQHRGGRVAADELAVKLLAEIETAMAQAKAEGVAQGRAEARNASPSEGVQRNPDGSLFADHGSCRVTYESDGGDLFLVDSASDLGLHEADELHRALGATLDAADPRGLMRRRPEPEYGPLNPAASLSPGVCHWPVAGGVCDATLNGDGTCPEQHLGGAS